MVARKLLWEIESKNLLTKFQCGFIPAPSTTDQIMFLQSIIHQSFDQRRHTLAVFLDLSKAFDMTWRYKIIKTLHDWKF